jgi:hypothetical protein
MRCAVRHAMSRSVIAMCSTPVKFSGHEIQMTSWIRGVNCCAFFFALPGSFRARLVSVRRDLVSTALPQFGGTRDTALRLIFDQSTESSE